MRKIGIVGLGPSQEQVPWGEEGWEWWGLAWDQQGELYNRLYDIHNPLWGKTVLPAGIPIWVQEEAAVPLPLVYPYPLKAIVDDLWPGTFPRHDQTDYFSCSVSYMVAHAIHERPIMIGLWGVEMTLPEHEYQRPCVEHLLGIAQGRGIKVYIAPGSALLQYRDRWGYYPRRYGWAA